MVPCYNYARFLARCVDSVLSQPDVGVRVLIIDDASSDDTAEVASALASSDARVTCMRHSVNAGHIATYNEGLLDWATAEYVVLLSADDLLAPGSLRRAARILRNDSGIGMVYGPVVHFTDERELPTTGAGDARHTRFSGAEWLERRCRSGHNVITSPEVVVRGTVQRAVGGYRADLPHAGDLEMWLRIAAVSDLAYVRGVPQAFHRVHPASMMRTTYRSALLDLSQRRAAFEAFFRDHPDLTAGRRLRDLARRALAREALWNACRAYDRNEVIERAAAALVEFAHATCADTRALREYRALGRRRRLGPTFCHRTQLFLPSAVLRRLGRWVARRRWQRRGA